MCDALKGARHKAEAILAEQVLYPPLRFFSTNFDKIFTHPSEKILDLITIFVIKLLDDRCEKKNLNRQGTMSLTDRS